MSRTGTSDRTRPTLGLLTTLALLTACGTSTPAGADVPRAALSVEAEQGELGSGPDLAPQATVEPGARTNAQIISDPAASGGQAVLLGSAGSAVRFAVPAGAAAGRYSVRVRARGELYQGAPMIALRRADRELARAELTAAGYTLQELGQFDLKPGDRLSVVFLNDAYAGPGRDRNAVIDHLQLDPVGATPTPTPVPAPSPAPAPGGISLPPVGKVAWDWQIGAGGDDRVTVAPGVRLMSLDGFDLSAGRVAQLRAQGVYPVCYINVGSYEPWRPDAAQYPAALKLQQDPDWPQEYFLDVTDVFRPNSALAAILTRRFQMCRDKGFAAVEPDNLQNDENVSGGRITTQQQIDFNGWVADLAHSLGLAALQKNGPDKVLLRDRTGRMMVEKFDGILNEECQQYGECAPLAEYVRRGKLALNVEYGGVTLDCALSGRLNINSIKKDLGLVGGAASGYVRQTCP